MATGDPTPCPQCRRETLTIGGRCPHCGCRKDPSWERDPEVEPLFPSWVRSVPVWWVVGLAAPTLAGMLALLLFAPELLLVAAALILAAGLVSMLIDHML